MVSKYMTDMIEFNDKFGLPISDVPRNDLKDYFASKVNHIFEEAEELSDAVSGDGPIQEAADAIGDLLYVTFGLALAMGIPIDDVWAEIHHKNMQKIRKPSKRSVYDVIKPINWTPPEFDRILWPAEQTPGMLIIIEGSDCSGKSTLVEKLKSQVESRTGKKAFTKHHGYPMNPNMRICNLNALSWAINAVSRGHVVIFDRFWPSDIVYSRIMRGEPAECEINNYTQVLEQLACQVPNCYIFCHCDHDVLKKRLRPRINAGREMYNDTAKLTMINNIFTNIGQILSYNPRVKAYTYNTSDPDESTLGNYLIDYIIDKHIKSPSIPQLHSIVSMTTTSVTVNAASGVIPKIS